MCLSSDLAHDNSFLTFLQEAGVLKRHQYKWHYTVYETINNI